MPSIALISFGKTYVVSLLSDRFYYANGDRAIGKGGSFTASQTDAQSDALRLGAARGHITEVYDQTVMADRVARRDELMANLATFIGMTFGRSSAQRRVANDAVTAQFLSSNASSIVVNAVLADQLEVTGTVAASGKYLALLNGVADGTVFTVGSPGAFSHTFVGNPGAGDVIGVQAMEADGTTVASTAVNVTVTAADVVLSPATAGDTVVTFSIVRDGTYQAKINGVNSGSAVAKTAGSGRTLTLGATLVGGDVVGVFESTAPITELVSETVTFKAPAITSPVIDSDSTVLVTSSPAAANGTAVNVYRSGVSIGSGVVAGGAGSCTVSVSNILPGDSLTAKHGAGASLSAASTAVVVQFNTATVAAIAPGAHVTGTETAADGSLVTFYVQSLGVGLFNAATPTGTVTSNAFNITPATPLVGTDKVKVKVGPADASQSAFSNTITVT